MRKLNKPENGHVIKLLKYFERISTCFSDHVITVTELWRYKLINRSVPASKCTAILNVPDDCLFKPYTSIHKTASNKLRLSYHGSLEEHFGVDLLLDVIPAVKLQVPNIELVIYGMGRLRNTLDEQIKNFGMSDYVRIYDFVPFYMLPTVLEEAAIGVVPTKADVFSGEALSMKALEYMALGIPVVISRTPVHNYYYNDSMVKFFTPSDKEDFTKAIIELCRDENARIRLSENAKKYLQEHGWQTERKKYYEIVDRLIEIRCGKS
jgi:glycosyltransferase involved in cell wall biosynthesis